jgi:putative ABC transport system permease protein
VIRASLKGMAGRKLRTALTMLAIVLGVAMITGTYVLTDTMTSAADALSGQSYAGVDAVVSSRQAFEPDEQESFSEPLPLPADTVRAVERVPGVQTASPEITDFAKLVKDGEPLSAEAPPFAVGFNGSDPAAAELSPFQLREGEWPSGPTQVAIDAGTAEREGLGLGDRVGLQARGEAREFEIAGTITFGSVESIGDATGAVLDLPTAQEVFDKRGQVDSILVAAEPGVSSDELRRRLADALPPTAQVESAEEQDRFGLEGLQEFIDIIQTALLAFGGIALFVGAFIIFNTLSITVAQRSREFALLRTIGASRRQVLLAVVAEALVIGLLASGLGIGAGLLLAKGLNSVFESLGLDLPQTGTVFKTRTVIIALAVGTLVTLAAGLFPALRATRTPPVAALREGAVATAGGRSRLVSIAAIVTIVVGVALLAYGAFGSGLGAEEVLSSLGVGCVLLFIGVAMISSRLVRPLASALGRPAEWVGGVAGSLARENSMRNPARTAVTAAALMIGLALVAFVAVFGQGLSDSFGQALDDQLETDYMLVNEDGFSPFAPEASEAAATAPGVSVVSSVRVDQARVDDDDVSVAGVDPQTASAVLQYEWKEGSDTALSQLGANGVIVTEQFAEDRDLAVGQSLEALSPIGKRLRLKVLGVQSPPEFDPLNLGDVTMSQHAFDAAFATERNSFTFIKTSGGPRDETARAIEQRIEPFADVELKTQAQYEEDTESEITGFLGLLYVLLALSVIVSLIGIVNTLVLSVFERTRELGMLRAVGMTRRQVRRMIRHESIITALIGSVLGMAVGVFLAFLVTRALEDEGIVWSFPFASLVVFAIIAVVAGIVAAILPARRAARLDVLRALQYE